MRGLSAGAIFTAARVTLAIEGAGLAGAEKLENAILVQVALGGAGRALLLGH